MDVEKDKAIDEEEPPAFQRPGDNEYLDALIAQHRLESAASPSSDYDIFGHRKSLPDDAPERAWRDEALLAPEGGAPKPPHAPRAGGVERTGARSARRRWINWMLAAASVMAPLALVVLFESRAPRKSAGGPVNALAATLSSAGNVTVAPPPAEPSPVEEPPAEAPSSEASSAPPAMTTEPTAAGSEPLPSPAPRRAARREPPPPTPARVEPPGNAMPVSEPLRVIE